MRAPARVVPLIVIALALPALAGCFGEEPAPVTTFKAMAQGNVITSLGWDYDGAALVTGTGNVSIDVDSASNTGTVVATVSLGPNETYQITFNSFAGAPDKPFQDGGIALNLPEHGDTGNGDALIPKLHALAAAWGTATVTKNGAAYPDPVSGSSSWLAHFMATDTGIRSSAGKITKADGATAYDPTTPADGASEAGDRELWLVIRSNPVDAAPAATPVSFEDTVNAPASAQAYGKDFPFTVNEPGPTAPTMLNVSLAPATGAAAQANLQFTIVGADGNPVGSPLTLTLPTGTATGTLGPITDAGAYTLKVSGTGVNAKFAVAGNVEYPKELLLAMLFEDFETA